jgi:predicted RNA-binding protein with PUA-like domain
MIVNFRTRGISRGTHKLTRTSTLIIIKKKSRIEMSKFVEKNTRLSIFKTMKGISAN